MSREVRPTTDTVSDPERDLDLDLIPTELRSQAVEALDARDVERFLGYAANKCGLELVWRNLHEMRRLGLYERALLEAFTETEIPQHCIQPSRLRSMFILADRELLRSAGEPLPGPGPFTLYRGVAGRGRARRVRGISWTGTRTRAE